MHLHCRDYILWFQCHLSSWFDIVVTMQLSPLSNLNIVNVVVSIFMTRYCDVNVIISLVTTRYCNVIVEIAVVMIKLRIHYYLLAYQFLWLLCEPQIKCSTNTNFFQIVCTLAKPQKGKFSTIRKNWYPPKIKKPQYIVISMSSLCHDLLWQCNYLPCPN